MTTDSGGWRLTSHARERMADRGITIDQVEAVLRHPELTLPDPKGRSDDVRCHVGGDVLVIANHVYREVITVGINGASSLDWETFAAPAASADEHPPPPYPVRATPRRRTREAERSEPIEERNVLDGVHPLVAQRVRRLLAERGLDYRHVVVLSPTDVRIAV